MFVTLDQEIRLMVGLGVTLLKVFMPLHGFAHVLQRSLRRTPRTGASSRMVSVDLLECVLVLQLFLFDRKENLKSKWIPHPEKRTQAIVAVSLLFRTAMFVVNIQRLFSCWAFWGSVNFSYEPALIPGSRKISASGNTHIFLNLSFNSML